jgi:hypothetical protein
MSLQSTNIGIAGEFYVLAQLAQRNFVAALTLANTKGVDILVSNATLQRLFKLEVKTTDCKTKRESLFGASPFFTWTMSEKHEQLDDPNLVFCFVTLRGESLLPRFFLVPSSYVSQYVREQHRYWLRTRVRQVANTTMRRFRIDENDRLGFENNWGLLMGDPPRPEQCVVSEPWCPPRR